MYYVVCIYPGSPDMLCEGGVFEVCIRANQYADDCTVNAGEGAQSRYEVRETMEGVEVDADVLSSLTPDQRAHLECCQFEGLEFLPALNDACQYSTVYAGERPVGTLQRRRTIDRTGPIWTLYAVKDAALLRTWHMRPSYRALARATHRALKEAALIRTEVR